MSHRKSLKDTALDRTAVAIARATNIGGGGHYKDLDLAIVKATNRDEVFPKEKHVRTILGAVLSQSETNYIIKGLLKKLKAPGNSWLQLLKTLMVIHRAIRDGGKPGKQEIVNCLRQDTGALDCSNFKDDATANAWERSAWCRNYALYIEERVHCIRTLGFDVEDEAQDGPSLFRDMATAPLLKNLEALQAVMRRLLDCKPESAMTVSSTVIQGALSMVVRESFKLFRSIQGGIINLVDKYFEMSYLDARKSLNLYKMSVNQSDKLTQLYASVEELEVMKKIDLPAMEKPPDSFITTMEEYLSTAPRTDVVEPRRASAIRQRASTAGASVADAPLLAVPLPEATSSPAQDLFASFENTSTLSPTIQDSTTPQISSSSQGTPASGGNGSTSSPAFSPSGSEAAPEISSQPIAPAADLTKNSLDSLYDQAIRDRAASAPRNMYDPYSFSAQAQVGFAPAAQPQMVSQPPIMAQPAMANVNSNPFMSAPAMQPQYQMQQQPMQYNPQVQQLQMQMGQMGMTNANPFQQQQPPPSSNPSYNNGSPNLL